MRFEFLAVLYSLACALPPLSAALPQVTVRNPHALPQVTIVHTWGSLVNAAPDHRPAVYEWRPHADTSDEFALYLDGVQVGAYNYVYGHYRPLLYVVPSPNGPIPKWGEPSKAPTQPPLRPPKMRGGVYFRDVPAGRGG